MRDRFPRGAFGVNAGQLYDELESIGLTTPRTVSDALGLETSNYIADAREEIQKFNEWIEQNADGTQLLQPETSDIVLISLLRKYAEKVANNHPGGRGLGRPSRIAWIARRYLQMSQY
jgi:hypothetical protein